MNSPNRLRLVEENEILALTNLAKNYLPESMTIYGFLSVGFKYKTIEEDETKIFIPEKRDSAFFAVITGVNGKARFPTISIYWESGSINKSIIADYLFSLKEINWKQPIGVAACEENILNELEEIVRDERLCGHVLKRYKADVLGVHWMKDDVEVPSIPLPENFQLGEVNPENIGKVLEHWSCSVVEAMNNVEIIVKTLPSSAVYYKAKGTTSKEMVAWSLTKHNGEIGLTHTLPEFRNKKLATIIICDLVRKHKKLGFLPNATINDRNLASIKLNEKVGFTRAFTAGWELYQNPRDRIFNDESLYNGE